jgi:hypothetical protein
MIPARPLAGVFVGLSISESENAEAYGFPGWQVNRAALQFSAALLGQGAGVVFGHNWRDDGVMEAVHAFALQAQPIDAADRGDADHDGISEPLLRNLLPWPDQPALPPEELERLAATLRVERVGLPPDLRDFEDGGAPEPLQSYLRARALTFMRRNLNANIRARVCVGGRERGFSGRYPGIIEEAAIAIENDTPLYLIGALGGATRAVIDAMAGREMPDGFAHGRSRELYENPDLGLRFSRVDADNRFDPHGVWALFKELRLERLAALNGLAERENVELFNTPSMARAIQLVLKGLGVTKRASSL